MSRLRRLLRPVNWAYALGELTLIVVGVLIALGTNAGWQAAQDRAREQSYLQQLLEDTRENERRLGAAIAEEERYQRAAVTLLDALGTSEPIPPDSLWTGERDAMGNSYPRLLTGTLATLQQTGDLNLLSDRRVRAAVVGYAGALDTDRAEFSRWLERKSATEERFGAQAQRAVRGRRPREGIMREWVTALRHDPELRVIVESMIFTGNNRRRHLHRMLEETEQLRRTLEETIRE